MAGRSFLTNDSSVSSLLDLKNINFNPFKRIVLVDSREFKSQLPSYLYHYGFTVVPIFL